MVMGGLLSKPALSPELSRQNRGRPASPPSSTFQRFSPQSPFNKLVES